MKKAVSKQPAQKAATKGAAERTPAKKTGVRKRGPKKAAQGWVGGKRVPSTRVKRPVPLKPVIRLVKVKELDPIAKCGPATSVEQLYRVDEQANGQATVHLVFFDRHGWYCVHGPRCAAVTDVHSHTRARAAGR